MNKMKSKKLTTVIPKNLLAIVCDYYGIGDVKHLAGSARPDLWRYPVREEARRVACWMLQRHCDLSVEELQAALKQLQWSDVSIRVSAEQAKRKLASGDFAFRLGVQGIEQLLMLELGGVQRCSDASTKRRRKGRLNWMPATYLMNHNDKGENAE